MAKQKTISDFVKAALAEILGDKEKDWKRQGSVRKDEEGSDLRTFVNLKTGLTVNVIDKDGQFNCEASDAGKFSFSLKKDFSIAAASETDPATAGRYSFAIGCEDGTNEFMKGLYVCFMGEDGEEEHLEGEIGHLLPENRGELLEATFDFSNYADARKLKIDLVRAGFVWDEGFQRQIDENTGNDLFDTLNKPASAGPASPKRN